MRTLTDALGEQPQQLRRELQNSTDPDLSLRRAVVAVSLVGIGAMALTTLLQMGVVRHLPEPRVGNFRTKKVNSSDEAYSYGGPDSPIAIVAHGFNIVLASTAGRHRAITHPTLPLTAAATAGAQAAVAARYLFYTMPKVDRAWCPYCIVDAVSHFATFALVLPEAARAAATLLRRRSLKHT